MAAELGNSTFFGEQNVTLFEPSISRSECITWQLVLYTVSATIVILNGLSIIVFLRDRSLRKRHMYLVINLTVADLFAGLFSPSMLVYNLGFLCPKGDIFLWQFWFAVGNLTTGIFRHLAPFFLHSSFVSLVVISLERLHATFRPFKHRLMKKRTIGTAVFAVWFTAGIWVAADILLFWYGGYLPFFILINSVLSCCLLIILVSYASIVAKINWGTHPRRHGGVSKERKLTKTLFIVTSVSLMLSLPHIVLWSVAGNVESVFYDKVPHGTIIRSPLVALCLLFANSLVNPIFYAFRIPEFKRALFSVLMCRPLSARHVQEFPLNGM
ncbi:adrenocorticotropic hormone receptor-like [Montipora capricornis]|uniref:adrenocorticotropic hormone receptor-like n=1 Tax=Montipora capricornis TaxID=246305 RepID=UPI0035F15042